MLFDKYFSAFCDGNFVIWLKLQVGIWEISFLFPSVISSL